MPIAQQSHDTEENMAFSHGKILTTMMNSFMFVYVFCFSITSVRAEIHTAIIDKQTGLLAIVEGYKDGFVAWANYTDDIKNSG